MFFLANLLTSADKTKIITGEQPQRHKLTEANANN